MDGQKRYRTFPGSSAKKQNCKFFELFVFLPHCPVLLALSVLTAFLLAGCRAEEHFPIYPMGTRADTSQTLFIDDVQYQRDPGGDRNEQAHYYNDGDQYVWTPAEGIGRQIGICGEGAESGGGFAVYEIAGDENRMFLYTAPRKLYSGGVDTLLWMRDGITLQAPAAEIVSSVTVVSKGEDALIQVNDPVLIAALLDAYNSDSVQLPGGGDQAYGSLIMHHKDFSFLQYEIEYRCSLQQEKACCQNKDGTWLLLPAEWYTVLSTHDVSAGSS